MNYIIEFKTQYNDTMKTKMWLKSKQDKAVDRLSELESLVMKNTQTEENRKNGL